MGTALAVEGSPAADDGASALGVLAHEVQEWHKLGVPRDELCLEFCLPTGQSFRWRKTGDNEFTGVIGDRLVCLRQREDAVLYRVVARGRGAGASPAEDAAALRDYFNLDTRLSQLAAGWAASCSRFRDVSPHFPGARMLRQDPLECLFQFICSSNNHISRIHGMVERICSSYGTPLEPTAEAGAPAALPPPPQTAAASLEEGPGAPPKGARKRAGKAAAAGGATAAAGGGELSYYAFPTLEQLSVATEEELRAAGFGYRARFLVGTTRALLAKPGGGREWLLGLRRVGLEEAVEALTELPGIGPKVAACICLFSLDKHAAIPVDTHVWQIAVRHYCPQLRGKSLTKKVHAEVQRVFVERFGPYAGWAHNTLFISDLASQQHRLPEHLRQGKASGTGAGGKRRQGRRAGGGEDHDDEDADEEQSAGTSSNSSAPEGDDGDEDGAPGVKRRSRDAAARRTAAAAATATATAAAAVPAPSLSGSRRGAGRGRQQAGRKAGAAVELVAGVAPGEAAGSRGAAPQRSSSSSGEAAAAPACAAVVDGQADLGSPPARGGRRRGAAAARGRPELEPGAGRNKRRTAGGARGAPAATAEAPPPGYRLQEFDDLVT